MAGKPIAALFIKGKTITGADQCVFTAPYDQEFTAVIKDVRPFFDRDMKAWLFSEEKKPQFIKIAKDYYDIEDFTYVGLFKEHSGSKDHKTLQVAENACREVIDAAYLTLVANLGKSEKERLAKKKLDMAYDRLVK